VLIDCGLFQGYKQLRPRNWARLPYEPRKLDAALLTHAHLDHSGFLPRLVSQGFDKRIICTRGTLELCRVLLPDSGHIQEEDAAFANRHGISKHKPALPLYTVEEAEASLQNLRGVDMRREVEIAPGIRAEFRPAGHLLGASFVRISTAVGRHRQAGRSGDERHRWTWPHGLSSHGIDIRRSHASAD
jgi:metallo-beta-lactamase family protein